MKILYLDESGDHSLSIIDQEYPVFVLGGVVLDKDYAEGQLIEKFNKFKIEMFGDTEIILHTADISRNRKGYKKMWDPEFRINFYRKLNSLMLELEYSVIACVILKEDYRSIYGVDALDPYLLSLNSLVERFCINIGPVSNGGIIVAEKRASPTLDQRLNIAWTNLNVQGTSRIRANQIESRVVSLKQQGKNENVAGLQLADLVVSPIGRYAIGKKNNKDWDIVRQKFWRNSRGEIENHGLVMLPEKREGQTPHLQ